jgi:protein-disulfide isomerase
MAATTPAVQRRPSGRAVVVAFGIAIAVTAALVAVVLVTRDGGAGAPPTASPVVDLAGIPQAGGVLGDQKAKVTLIEYADIQCPACRFYAEETLPGVVNEYVRPGLLKAEFRGYPFLGPDSVKAERFLLAAGRQNKLWQLVEGLYRYQGGENEGWVTDDLIRERAAEIPGLDVDRLFTDADSAQITEEAEAAAPAAQAAGIPGTPTFFIQIGDEEPYFLQAAGDLPQLRAALDDALRG